MTGLMMGDSTGGAAVEPSADKAVFGPDTVAELREIIARYPRPRSALLPMLHLVQSVEGYVSRVGVRLCAELLDLSVAEVDAVVTFYTMYKRKPCGEHLISVCTNTLCAALGGDAIYARLRRYLGDDGTSPPTHEETFGNPGEAGSITLEHVECLAACDLAPVLQVNYDFFDKQTPESARQLVDQLRNGERPAPSRGPGLTSFRAAQRQLAGFFDEHSMPLDEAVTGFSAAEETLRGAQRAVDEGWTAPATSDDVPLPVVEERK